ncbi:MAG: HPF/RaiA family ribosome-associated protein [Betaproteobacteria bacterium]|nr:HPF/RaiA family ribosome-associated protein [Betaproteobacteria bacterium]
MQVPLQITFHDLPPSNALEARIREKAGRLDTFHPRIMSCRVVIEARDRHRQQGKQYTARIDVRVPRHEVVINRDHDEDVFVAVRDGFDAMTRRLEDVVRIERGDVKAHDIAQHGRVTRLFTDEGYGFIVTPDRREFYFSRDNVVEPSFDHLEPGIAVQFIEEAADEGAQAKRVSVGKHAM